jgi:hypothetical protein
MKPPKRNGQNHQNGTAKTTENINYRKNGKCKNIKILNLRDIFFNFKTIGGGGTQRTLTTLAQNTNIFRNTSLLVFASLSIYPLASVP